MTCRREQDGSAGRISAAGGALTEFMRIFIFFVLIASVAAVLAAGTAKPDDPFAFEDVPLCVHSVPGG